MSSTNTLTKYEKQLTEDLDRGFFHNAWRSVVAIATTVNYVSRLLALVTLKSTDEAIK